jgi:hypothetical protein
MKHFYMVAKKGNQSIWVVDQPTSYGEWDFELFGGKSAADLPGPVVTASNCGAPFAIAALAVAASLIMEAPASASESLAEPAPKKDPAMESAKRRAPVAKPVVVNGVRYEQMRRAKDHGYTQGGGVIAAVEAKTDKLLWSVQLYKTTYDPSEEQDAQEIYVKELALDKSGQALLASDERKRVWSIDLATHAVTQVSGPEPR